VEKEHGCQRVSCAYFEKAKKGQKKKKLKQRSKIVSKALECSGHIEL